jgi:hypothetical protein
MKTVPALGEGGGACEAFARPSGILRKAQVHVPGGAIIGSLREWNYVHLEFSFLHFVCCYGWMEGGVAKAIRIKENPIFKKRF